MAIPHLRWFSLLSKSYRISLVNTRRTNRNTCYTFYFGRRLFGVLNACFRNFHPFAFSCDFQCHLYSYRSSLASSSSSSSSAFYSTNNGEFFSPIPLNRIVRMNLLEKESPENIKSIWVNYFRQKDSVVGGVLSSETFSKLKERATRCPIFVFPIPREQGYFSMLSQMQAEANICAFTSLEVYKKDGDNSRSFLTMVYYTDLLHSKDLVLMRGTFDSTLLKSSEAQFLVNVWQWFLLEDRKFKLMEEFNRRPENFNFERVVQEIDTLPSSTSSITPSSSSITSSLSVESDLFLSDVCPKEKLSSNTDTGKKKEDHGNE